MLLRLPHALLAICTAFVACKAERPATKAEAASDTAVATPAASATTAPITVTATDFKLELPAQIPAGVVTFHLVNKGKELHQAQIIRLEGGKTLADFQKGMKENGPPPPWVKSFGGPNGIAPGAEASATAVLAPGNYAVLCFIPGPDGVPHIMKGMVQPFEVTGTATAGAQLPTATDTFKLVDYAFESSRQLTPGHHTILVDNTASQPHELVLLKLSPGQSVKDFATWATTGGMKGPPPAMPIGGVVALDPGVQGEFTADLEPGDYGLICFVSDAKDGKMHLEHGMIRQIKVAS